ncbi:LysR substrate-binding domain-containing protein [Achromobacter spanius]|uniref:LysR substrate-binding domain-containing protein n=1 Tax=Achromobacter spanius TaxID=217203 RepID=UPI00381587AB
MFRAVMQVGTTRKAAELLCVSQSAVSQALARLEKNAGLRFFERVRGRLVPTREAAALMVQVDRFFTGFEMIEHCIRGLKTVGLARLTVASFPALGAGFLPRAIEAFDPARRDMLVSLQIMSSRDVYQQVMAGQADFGLMADELPVDSLEHSVFLEVPGVIVMHAHHPLVQRRLITLEDMAAHPFIALNPEDQGRIQLERALAQQDLMLSPVVETPYSSSICELALRGVGIGMAHPLTALDYLPKGLVLKRMAVTVNARTLLVIRPGAPLAGTAKEFLKAMRIQLQADLSSLTAYLDRPS